MARLIFRCSREEKCPNNPPNHMGTGNEAGEFNLFFQSWFDAEANHLVKWHAKGIRCGCGAPFASIRITEPNMPDAMAVPPLPMTASERIDAAIGAIDRFEEQNAERAAAEEAEFAALEASDATAAAAVRRWYGGRMPWETDEARTSPQTPDAIRASSAPPGAPSSTEPNDEEPPASSVEKHDAACATWRGGECDCPALV